MIDTPSLSLFYKILIFIEDRDGGTLSELERLGPRRQMLGALGRLEGLGYIEREKNDRDDHFTLTEEGDQVLASVLDFIPKPNSHWDGHWRMILFDIPEAQRTIRQTFRLKLQDLGARMFQSSVWLAPNSQVLEKFNTLVSDLGYNDYVHYFEAKSLNPQTVDINDMWNLTELQREYRHLFRVIQDNIKKLKKDPLASYHAKCMIVALALLSKKDPHLPQELMPNDWIGKEVPQWHAKLRAFCQS